VKIGIIGLSQSGKTTVFKALVGKKDESSADAEQKSKVQYGNIKVPDERIDKISQLVAPEKIIPSEVTFVDEVEAVYDKFKCFTVDYIKEVEAITTVIRYFKNESVPHPLGDIDIIRDINQVEDELMLADLEVIQKRFAKLQKEIKGGKKENQQEFEVLQNCLDSLEKEQPLRNLKFSPQQENILSGFGFLSKKPLLVLINIDEDKINESLPSDIEQEIKNKHLSFIKFCAKVEAEIQEIEPSQQEQFLKELNIEESAKERFAKGLYDALNLISFFTIKNNILKSWTVEEGTACKEAAGKIHSDIERGFIKAEVVGFKEFVKYGDFSECKKNNILQLKGKDYLVQDGDVIDFKFNI
jgi:hypothetical protein